MQRFAVFMLVGLVPLVNSGCGPKSEPPSLDARLQAAIAVEDPFKRDAALEKVAKDAADAGNPDVTKQALPKIGDTFKRDSAASTCAFKLAKAGKSDAAVEVARSISESHKRDFVLGKLSKGETDE